MKFINWMNCDVLSPNDLHFSIRFQIKDSVASVWRGTEQVEANEVLSWYHVDGSRYRAEMSDGSSWDVVKLRCKCSGSKSGRIW